MRVCGFHGTTHNVTVHAGCSKCRCPQLDIWRPCTQWPTRCSDSQSAWGMPASNTPRDGRSMSKDRPTLCTEPICSTFPQHWPCPRIDPEGRPACCTWQGSDQGVASLRFSSANLAHAHAPTIAAAHASLPHVCACVPLSLTYAPCRYRPGTRCTTCVAVDIHIARRTLALDCSAAGTWKKVHRALQRRARRALVATSAKVVFRCAHVALTLDGGAVGLAHVGASRAMKRHAPSENNEFPSNCVCNRNSRCLQGTWCAVHHQCHACMHTGNSHARFALH